MKIVSRAEAKEQGLKRYFTGKPCKRGHICESWVCDRACTDCAKEKRQTKKYKDYQLKYQKDNKNTLAEKDLGIPKSITKKIGKQLGLSTNNIIKIILRRIGLNVGHIKPQSCIELPRGQT